MDVGFGKASVYDLVRPAFNPAFTDLRLVDELSIIVLALREGATTAFLYVADLESFHPTTVTEMRGKLAQALSVPAAHIAMFVTQNHSAPLIPYEHTERLVNICAQIAREALAAAQPADVLPLTVRPEPTLNFRSRVTVPGLGAMTFWRGYRPVAPGQCDVGHLMDLSLRNMARGEAPVRGKAYALNEEIPAGHQPVLLEPARDTALQALFFRAKAGGRPLGVLTRFASHPCLSDVPAHFATHSGDWPVYLRRALEREFGGMAMFFTGPCGDAHPPMVRRVLADAQRYGETVARQLWARLPGAQWQALSGLAAREVSVRLQVRRDFPASLEAVEAEIGALTAKLKSPRSLLENRKLLDRLEFLTFYKLGSFNHYTRLLEANLRPDGVIDHVLPLWRIGPAVLAGLPGEPFSAYAVKLREATLGDRLIVCDQANGYLGYFATAAEVPEGSYAVNFALFDERAEAALLDPMTAAIRALGL